MKLLGLMAASMMAVLTLSVRAESPQTRALSLEDCIQIAIQHNLDVQIVRTGPQIAQFTLSGSYGSYDPQFRFSGSHDSNLAPGGFDEQGRVFEGTESKIDNFGSGISGLLPWGLNYELGGRVSAFTARATYASRRSPFPILKPARFSFG